MSRGAVRSLRFCGTIQCLSGSVWLTVSGQPADYLLRPGDTLAVTAPGVVLQALEEAVVCCA